MKTVLNTLSYTLVKKKLQLFWRTSKNGFPWSHKSIGSLDEVA